MSLPRRQLLATSDVPQLPLPSQNELSDVPPLQPRMIAEVQGQPELSTSIKQVPQSQPASQLAHSIGCIPKLRRNALPQHRAMVGLLGTRKDAIKEFTNAMWYA